MDLSKHLDHGTSDLNKQLSHLDLNKILMNHVCPRDIKIKQKFSQCFILMIFYSLERMLGVMSLVKIWLSSQFNMKDLGEVNYILGIKLWQIERIECQACHKLDIQIRFQQGLACKTPRKDCFLSDMEFLYPMTKGLRLLKRKRQRDKFPMLQQLEVSCMPCYVLGQISVIQLTQLADINQIQDQNIGRL